MNARQRRKERRRIARRKAGWTFLMRPHQVALMEQLIKREFTLHLPI